MIDRNTIQLLRIPFSFYLMPVFLFALSQAKPIHIINAIAAFLILHVFVYPASNGYNSYMDQDEGPIGGLKNPPKATKKLFYAALSFDITALILSLFISKIFFVCILLYIIASRAYSFKGIRLKKYPFVGFITVIFVQGAFTFFMVYQCITQQSIPLILNSPLQIAMIASSVLLAGVYPLTQVYQHEEDFKQGDKTISYLLGYRGTFIFSSIAFLITNLLFWHYFNSIENLAQFYILQVFFIPIAIYFVSWMLKVFKNTAYANFENTMRMNKVASICMGLCFLLLLILNQIL
ncbi:UbiA family prenyltransferase [Solitalea koreensis]|uniref:1,4-dihydroxy-2-naphthoate octaprenyltransferase n=1 Tax=Solitalea koreensis TaxID=543615 RepID=A0A521AS09_9SPHI|nr:UbiA family prenyltransferase [Solitalea koreensis]SMO37614.1 1,4-dihydroxy-2-naphthoate octaprenyltransferase [Solitalea koreensis]